MIKTKEIKSHFQMKKERLHMKVLADLDVSLLKIYQFVKLNNTVVGNVKIYRGEYIVDGKSLLGVLSLDLTEKATVEIDLKGEQYYLNGTPQYLHKLTRLGFSYSVIE